MNMLKGMIFYLVSVHGKGMVLPGCDGADTHGRAPPWRCCSPVWSGLGRTETSI